MKFGQELVEGRLLRRYKRFLADVELEDGRVVTAHTANPGGMLGLTTPGSAVWLSYHDKPTRKLKYSWELIRVGRTLVGINPMRTNDLVVEAVERGKIPELADYAELRREVKYGEASRIDILLEDAARPACYVEVKNVTLVEGRDTPGALFPDAQTERGRKHLRELRAMVAQGERGVLCFVVQRSDVRWVGAADHIDPEYGALLREVLDDGVELIAYRAEVGREGIAISERLDVRL